MKRGRSFKNVLKTPKKTENDGEEEEEMSRHEKRALLVSKQQNCTTFQFSYALVGILLTLIQTEYMWSLNSTSLTLPCPKNDDTGCAECTTPASTSNYPVSDGEMILNAIRLLVSGTTIAVLFEQRAYYRRELELLKLTNVVPTWASIASTSLKWSYLLEFLAVACHPFPGIEYIDPKWPNLTVSMSLLMFLRLGLLARIIKYRSSLNSTNGWFIGALTHVEFNAAFFIKTSLKNHPRRCVLIALLIILSITGYCTFVIERFACAFATDSCCEPMSFGNGIWMLIVTVLTIGYGDVTPGTTAGRAIAVTAGVSGSLMTAVLIALITNYLTLSRSEQKVNAFVQKDKNKRMIADHAARSLQAFFQYLVTKKKSSRTRGSRAGSILNNTSAARRRVETAEMKVFDTIRAYRSAKRQVLRNDGIDPMDKQMTALEGMELQVMEIKSQLDTLVSTDGTLFFSELYATSALSPRNGKFMTSKSPTSKQKSPRSRPPPIKTTEAEAAVTPSSPSAAAASTPVADSVPRWAKGLEKAMGTILAQVTDLSEDLEQVKLRVNAHMQRTNERFVVIESQLNIHIQEGKNNAGRKK